MQTLPIFIFCYFIFHSYLLKRYEYHQLSGHMIYIIFLQIYLAYRKQSNSYTKPKYISSQSKEQQNNQNQQVNMCKVCNKEKPSRYYHCRRCNICIYRMDHHCQWVGNCIGQYNAKTYFHFLINIFMHNIIVFLYIFVWDYYRIFTNQQRFVYLLIIIIPVILMLFQTQRLLTDFYSMVTINQTLIQSYKKVKGKDQSIFKNLSQFFGTSNLILWCISIYLPFQNPSESSDLYQKSVSFDPNQKPQQDLTYADEYIYGKDDQNQLTNQYEKLD